jgi:hypothetical protein
VTELDAVGLLLDEMFSPQIAASLRDRSWDVVDALEAWLTAGPPQPPLSEDWLLKQ